MKLFLVTMGVVGLVCHGFAAWLNFMSDHGWNAHGWLKFFLAIYYVPRVIVEALLVTFE